MNNPAPKTPDQLEQFGRAVNSRIGDFFDGHILVGISADTGQPVIIAGGPSDFKTLAVLNALMINALNIHRPTMGNG